MNMAKRAKISSSSSEEISEPFENLPDDLLIFILSKLSSSSSSPSDFINALIVCKRFNQLGMNPLVLSNACSEIFAVSAKNWSESLHRFLKLCINAGSLEACYFLGMVRFYCFGNRDIGASLMAKAAIKSHAPALFSLAVILYNGSGGLKSGKDSRAGGTLCARAARLGYVEAVRELGYNLQDGYGLKQNIAVGRRLLILAHVRELGKESLVLLKDKIGKFGPGFWSILKDLVLDLPVPNLHPVNRFLVEWFEGRELGPGLRICGNVQCGRPETRAHEFRRCSVCGVANYCSRVCQALDWMAGHKAQCSASDEDQ